MAQRSHVPKFGNWEGEESVPYTAYFDKARKGRTGVGGKMINPNDPEENPDTLSDISASSPPKVRPGPEKPVHERRRSREDNDLRFANSPAQRRTSGESAHQPNRGRSSGETYRRPARASAGSENSVERSPLHRNARVSGRDSPSWEGKASYESSHGTPARSRLKPRDESVNFLPHIIYCYTLINLSNCCLFFHIYHNYSKKIWPQKLVLTDDQASFEKVLLRLRKVLLFRNLASGMRTTQHQLMVSLTYSTKCGRRRREKYQELLLSRLTKMQGSRVPMTVPRVAAFHGAENEIELYLRNCGVNYKVFGPVNILRAVYP